jgi:succinate dehydrogenase/fumarate reductase flavoprotein subunit
METVEADVVVVGGGGSGLAAAVSAASAGARVVLLEKNRELGGSTRWSVGSITATGTPHQRRLGIADEPSAHYEDLGKLAGSLANRDNLALRRLLVENVPETIRWLREMGVEFTGPLAEPPHRVPRMHVVLPNSAAYIYHLGARARRLSVDVRLGHAAREIVVGPGGAEGIAAEGDGRRKTFRARRGIVIAGGDYSGNAEMKATRVRAELGPVPAVNPTATGDAQRMIEAIGGEVLNGDLALGPVLRFVRPPGRPLHERIPPYAGLTRVMRWGLDVLPPALVRPFVMAFMTTVMAPERSLFDHGAILVDSSGARLPVGEGTPGEAVAATADNTAHLILPDSVARLFSAWPHFISTAPGVAYAYLPDYRRTRPDLYRTAPDPRTLAKAMRLDEDRLAASVQDLPAGPLHALGPIHSYVVYTDGGVRVTERLEVVGRDGEPIPGLFAAGSTGQGGLLLEGHGHHLGWAFTSGRLAGRHAAAFERRTG